MIWALTLIVAVIPAVLLLLGVRWAADRLVPGYGTAAAVTLGLATIVMIFASEYFSHVISAALGFGAFILLMREREGPPSLRLVSGAGLLAGLAVTFEFQVGLVGVILFAYALARSSERLRRGARLRRRGALRRPADARLQPLGVREPAGARLRERGRVPGVERPRRARAEQRRVLRDHRAPTGQRR